MTDGDELDRDTRRSLRILAASTKQTSDRTAKRLERAAESGNKADYLEAEAMFNSLPPERRADIGTTAESRAKIVKAKIVEQRLAETRIEGPNAGQMTWEIGNIPGSQKPKKARGSGTRTNALKPPQPVAPPKVGGQVSWELNRVPPGTTRRKPAAEDEDLEDGKTWDWQKIPDDPVLRSARGKTGEIVDELELLRREIFGKKD